MTRKADQDDIERAKEKLKESGCDELTIESMSRTLSLAESAIDPPENEDPRRALAEVVFNLALSMAHFIGGSRRVMNSAIASHAEICAKSTQPVGKFAAILAILKIVIWPVSVIVVFRPETLDGIVKIGFKLASL